MKFTSTTFAFVLLSLTANFASVVSSTDVVDGASSTGDDAVMSPVPPSGNSRGLRGELGWLIDCPAQGGCTKDNECFADLS